MRISFSFLVSRIASRRWRISSLRTSTPFSQTVLSALMPRTVWSCVSGLLALLMAIGSRTSTPFCSSGAMIIMMMSSTSMTSTRGVTLMSALIAPLLPTCIDIVTTPTRCVMCDWRLVISPITNRQSSVQLRRLLDEVIDQLRRGVVHLHVEVLDAAGQEVIEPDRRNGDKQTQRGLDERFCNTGRDGADTTGT